MELDLSHLNVQLFHWVGGSWRRESQGADRAELQQQLQLPLVCTVLSGCLEWVTLPGAVPALLLVFQLTALKHSKKAEEQKLSEVQQRLEELEPIQEKVKE